MDASWISLPVHWKLEDVQAVLNVIIASLSAVALFVFIRHCWQRGARRALKDSEVPLHAILSVNTLGEALDVAFLLRSNLFSIRYAVLCAQIIVVIFLSTVAILSGPIARYSTRRGIVVRQQNVPGFLAFRGHNGMGYANVEWNLTYNSLEAADFPRDQLLDFLPDNTVNWVYEPDQWNNSWALDCRHTSQTYISLEVTENCTGLMHEIPDLEQVFSYTEYDDYFQRWDGFYNASSIWRDVLLWVYSTKKMDYSESEDTYHSMNFMLASIHLRGLQMADENSTECDFAPGKIDEADYTKVECTLNRADDIEDTQNIARPDVYTPGSVPSAYTAYYQARFAQQSTSDSPISVITPGEIVRFYQTYTIIKDLQYRQPVVRQLNVEVRLVQLSSTFLAFALLTALLIVLGLANYGYFAFRRRDIFKSTPQSKVDWILLSVLASSGGGARDKCTTFETATFDGGTLRLTLDPNRAPPQMVHHQQAIPKANPDGHRDPMSIDPSWTPYGRTPMQYANSPDISAFAGQR